MLRYSSWCSNNTPNRAFVRKILALFPRFFVPFLTSVSYFLWESNTCNHSYVHTPKTTKKKKKQHIKTRLLYCFIKHTYIFLLFSQQEIYLYVNIHVKITFFVLFSDYNENVFSHYFSEKLLCREDFSFSCAY